MSVISIIVSIIMIIIISIYITANKPQVLFILILTFDLYFPPCHSTMNFKLSVIALQLIQGAPKDPDRQGRVAK